MIEEIRALAQALREVEKDPPREAQRISRAPSGTPIPPAARRAIPFRLQLRVFRRDRFQCRYCGIRTVFVPALRLISIAFPSEFPFDPQWREQKTHRAYWRFAASASHLLSPDRGGKNEMANLVTACYRCNAAKGGAALGDIGWILLSPSGEPWDGLVAAFRRLAPIAVVKAPSLRVWVRAVEEADTAASDPESAARPDP